MSTRTPAQRTLQSQTRRTSMTYLTSLFELVLVAQDCMHRAWHHADMIEPFPKKQDRTRNAQVCDAIS
jgi:hypothetical protein